MQEFKAHLVAQGIDLGLELSVQVGGNRGRGCLGCRGSHGLEKDLWKHILGKIHMLLPGLMSRRC